MKMCLSEEEMQNVVGTLSQEDIKMYHLGDYKKWDVSKVEEGYTLEYIYTEKGDLKPKFAKGRKSE